MEAEDFNACVRESLASLDRLQATHQTKQPLACAAGCSLCCWLRVDVRAPEVFHLAEYIRARFDATALESLMARLTAHRDKVAPLTPFDHATRNVVCPLLQDGRCSVYQARPASCRRHHSTDLNACQFTYDHPTDLEFPSAHDRDLFRIITEAMSQGAEVYSSLGFDDTIYELGSALLEALESRTSWRRWRDHKKAFLRASTTPL